MEVISIRSLLAIEQKLVEKLRKEQETIFGPQESVISYHKKLRGASNNKEALIAEQSNDYVEQLFVI